MSLKRALATDLMESLGSQPKTVRENEGEPASSSSRTSKISVKPLPQRSFCPQQAPLAPRVLPVDQVGENEENGEAEFLGVEHSRNLSPSCSGIDGSEPTQPSAPIQPELEMKKKMVNIAKKLGRKRVHDKAAMGISHVINRQLKTRLGSRSRVKQAIFKRLADKIAGQLKIKKEDGSFVNLPVPSSLKCPLMPSKMKG